MKPPITDTQVRAARELLRWDQKKLASEAGLGIATIRRYETGQQVGEDTTADLVAALERAGVLFIGDISFSGIAIASAVALRDWAKPDERPPTRVYPPRATGRGGPINRTKGATGTGGRGRDDGRRRPK